MGTYGEAAKALFLEGYNCAQSVLLVFAPELGLDRETAAKIAASFGGGMGRLREVCGAVSGMFMAAGLYAGDYRPKDFAGKTRQYEIVQELARRFRAQYGSIVCRELLGLSGAQSPVPEQRTPEYYKKRPCPEMIAAAADLFAAFLAEQQGSDAAVPESATEEHAPAGL